MLRSNTSLFPLLAVGVILLTPQAGQAILITGSGTVDGQSVSASADFEVVGGNLQITLTNTAGTTNAAAQVLSNIEFNLNSGVVFNAGSSSSSVVVASGSTLVGASGPDISGGYGFATGVTFTTGPTAQFGISSVSFINASSSTTPIGGTFSPGIGGGHPNSLDGVDYGIIANAASAANDGLPNALPLVANSAVITLALASGSAAINLAQLSGVNFSYGSEQVAVPGTPSAVPEPTPIAMALIGLGTLGLAGLRRRLRRPIDA